MASTSLSSRIFQLASPNAPIVTQGIKYAGAKTKLLGSILSLVSPLRPRCVFDGFAGTTRVSQAFAQAGYRVIANDIALWSRLFAETYLQASRSDSHYQRILDHLNSLAPSDGWFAAHYGGEIAEENGESGLSRGHDGLKKPFQMHNARKIDAIRSEIDRMGLAQDEKNVALTSLILGLERVDSTLGHYVSYLREWSPRSYQSLYLSMPRLLMSASAPAAPHRVRHEVYQEDTIALTSRVEADVAYFDPPYGSNNDKMPPSRVRYASYYHLWKTIILNDQPRLVGAAMRRADCSDRVVGSVFEEFRTDASGRFLALDAIAALIRRTRARHIVLSYSSGGRATAAQLTEILQANGEVRDMLALSHRRNVMSHMSWTNDWLRNTTNTDDNLEYLFLLDKE